MALRPRTLTAAAAVALSGIVLSGCSQQEPAPELTTADVLYLTDLRRADVEFNSVEESTGRIRAGRDTCTSLDKTKTVPGAVKPLLTDFYPDDASVIVVAAIHSYCPQHAGLLAVPGHT